MTRREQSEKIAAARAALNSAAALAMPKRFRDAFNDLLDVIESLINQHEQQQ